MILFLHVLQIPSDFSKENQNEICKHLKINTSAKNKSYRLLYHWPLISFTTARCKQNFKTSCYEIKS